MAQSFFSADTIDDLMRIVIEATISFGEPVTATKGSNVELTGVLLELTNPRARLSRTETRGKPFSCLGELCWYLAASNDLDFIQYYIRDYEEFADNNIVYGGYGPRFVDWNGQNQLANVTNILKRKPSSRQAVIQLFDASDLAENHKDIPCTCTMQFLLRDNKLNMFTSMRSNDAFLGLPHDIFAFTMLQEIMARSLSVEIGTYKHAVGSIHIYDQHLEAAQQFLGEGWQTTLKSMPPMPTGDPWEAISRFLEFEANIRGGAQLDVKDLGDIDPYWGDLVLLLQAYRLIKDKKAGEIGPIRDQFSSDVYRYLIDMRLR